ncbi:hypothetical protein E2562_011403 [Oryza meyeriana var. granulata]|uniref:Secreted protein n=1 Tax=Oryza meyeriana var. granulata TaxID=110450 RepID=A0A6G1EA92_9ORYZ|nr:hypothetical protein E2562_011403 [Oryza meyeriana var. granulata]
MSGLRKCLPLCRQAMLLWLWGRSGHSHVSEGVEEGVGHAFNEAGEDRLGLRRRVAVGWAALEGKAAVEERSLGLKMVVAQAYSACMGHQN